MERPYAPSAVLPIDSEIAVVRFVDPLAGAIRSSDLGSGWMHEWQVGQAPVGTPMGTMQQGQGFSGGAVMRSRPAYRKVSLEGVSIDGVMGQLQFDDGSGAIRMVFSILFSRGVTSLTASC